MTTQQRRTWCICLLILFIAISTVSSLRHANADGPNATAASTAVSTSDANSPIQVSEETTQSAFRNYFSFHIKASSAAGNITSARISWSLGNLPGGGGSHPVDAFTPASEVALDYRWDTSQFTTPPWQIVTYRWQITDDAGNSYFTPPMQAEMSDDTRNWQKLSDGKVAVYWYDQTDDFGKELLDAAQKGYAHVAQATGHTPAHEIRIVLYNTQDDFCSFYATNECKNWVGGQTFGGLTVQWLDDHDYVMLQTVPHELAHAFLRDWMGRRAFAIPSWFDEGQAVNNQIAGIDTMLARARELASQNKLERLDFMEARATIGQDDLRKEVDWYAQATSLVAFLYDKYGLDSLGKIVTEVNSGKRFEQAMQEVTGMTMDQYELAWRAWLGDTAVPPTIAPSQTPFFPPTPTPDISFEQITITPIQ